MRTLIVAAAAIALSTSANAATNLVVNGGFEVGTSPAGSTELSVGSTSLFGWTVLSKGVTYVDNTVWDAAAGTRSIELGVDSGQGGLRQRVFGFNVGSKYVLSFNLSANPFDTANRPHDFRDLTSVSGGLPQIYNYTITAANSPTNMLYQTISYEFFASAKHQDLQFRSLTRGAFAPVIDTVSISAVPEASTWAMLIVGFGMVGLASRQRKRTVVAA